DALVKGMNKGIDPADRTELYLRLSEKYLRDAEELLAKGDYVQASEKAWGAAAQIVKALAAKEGIELRSHGELHRYVSKLSSERGDREIPRLWLSAVSLHQNFYENWLPGEIVEEGLESVKEFVEKLRKLL
ncbi:MAG: PaREP1 family protein, partial [Thermofilum sp.]|nr:PaREP1 family protein [Thermofilum sp.]